MKPAVAASPAVVAGLNPSFAPLRVAALGAAAVAGALALAVANAAWFDVLNGLLGLTDAAARALLFSSFLLLIGGAAVARDPAAFGLRAPRRSRDWRLVALACAAGALLTWLALRLAGSTPYDDASKLVEIVLVPVTEELVFRAVLLTLLVAAVARWVGGPRVLAIAVVIDGLSFGVAHAANALTLDPACVVMQVAFATVVGLGCAALMARTWSVYPAVLLHAVVNTVVVLS